MKYKKKKNDVIKTINAVRIIASIVLYAFSILAIVGICKGNYLHIITSYSFALLATIILRKW